MNFRYLQISIILYYIINYSRPYEKHYKEPYIVILLFFSWRILNIYGDLKKK